MTVNYPPPNLPEWIHASAPEYLHEKLIFQWIFDKQGYAFKAYGVEFDLIDIWYNKIIGLVDTWPEDRVMYSLQDFSDKHCAMTPYIRQTNAKLFRRESKLQITSVSVMPNSITMQLVRVFLRLTSSQKQLTYLTFDHTDGLTWLRRQVEKNRVARST